MQWFFPILAVQFDFLGGALGVAGAIVISFVIITLMASYYRFQNIIKMAETTQPEEMGATTLDILRVQLARYLAGCGRRGASFSISLIKVENPEIHVRMGAPFIEGLKHAVRCGDTLCIYDDHTAAILTEAEPEDSEKILVRVARMVAEFCPDLAQEELRIGIASYPSHGLSGKELLEVARQGLAQANTESPVVMPEVIDLDAEDDEEEGAAKVEHNEEIEEETSGGWKDRRKNAVLDELTGVLKPSAVSAYMQRLMSDMRHKKKKAALFCIGVNNLEHVTRIHGEEAADDVLVGVSKILKDHFRADDLIGRHEKYAFLVLAEATLDEAEIIGKRINSLVQQAEIFSGKKKLKTSITLGVAASPEHGRNLHSLYTAGQKVLDHSRINDIRAYAVYDPEIHDKVPSKPMKNIKSAQA